MAEQKQIEIDKTTSFVTMMTKPCCPDAMHSHRLLCYTISENVKQHLVNLKKKN